MLKKILYVLIKHQQIYKKYLVWSTDLFNKLISTFEQAFNIIIF